MRFSENFPRGGTRSDMTKGNTCDSSVIQRIKKVLGGSDSRAAGLSFLPLFSQLSHSSSVLSPSSVSFFGRCGVVNGTEEGATPEKREGELSPLRVDRSHVTESLQQLLSTPLSFNVRLNGPKRGTINALILHLCIAASS